MPSPLVETWEINDRIHAYLLGGIPARGLAVAPPSGGRTVGATFGHMHNVRLMWLEAAGAKIPDGLVKLDSKAEPTPAAIRKALVTSGKAVAGLIESSEVNGGRVKGFKPHVHAFVGYLISHESHHRGQITQALRAAGVPIDRKVAYGLWEWGVR